MNYLWNGGIVVDGVDVLCLKEEVEGPLVMFAVLFDGFTDGYGVMFILILRWSDINFLITVSLDYYSWQTSQSFRNINTISK